MMKKIPEWTKFQLFKWFLISGLIISSCSTPEEENLLSYVDPFIGTGGHGHTFPGAASPFGMVQISPDNGTSGWDWCSGYHYSDSIIAGFSHLHLSGTGIGYLADISVLPVNRPVCLTLPREVKNPTIVFDLGFSINWDQAIEASLRVHEDGMITGYRRSKGWARDQIIYFAAMFDQPVMAYDLIESGINSDMQEVKNMVVQEGIHSTFFNK